MDIIHRYNPSISSIDILHGYDPWEPMGGTMGSWGGYHGWDPWASGDPWASWDPGASWHPREPRGKGSWGGFPPPVQVGNPPPLFKRTETDLNEPTLFKRVTPPPVQVPGGVVISYRGYETCNNFSGSTRQTRSQGRFTGSNGQN